MGAESASWTRKNMKYIVLKFVFIIFVLIQFTKYPNWSFESLRYTLNAKKNNIKNK